MQVEFWAKTTIDDQPGISVFNHMVNVGQVAYCLAQTAPDLLNRFQIRPAEAAALAALHDLGKISPGFAQKCTAWLNRNHLTEIAQRWTWDTTTESDHGKVSHAAVQDFLHRIGADRRAAKFLSAVLGGHHGKINPPSDRGFRPSRAISEQHSGIDWDRERDDTAMAICNAFDANLKGLRIDKQSPVLWWLAGLTAVADWIGSDEDFFSAASGAKHADVAAIARQAISVIGFAAPEVRPGFSFHDLFHDVQRPEIEFVPNAMQLQAMSAITGPGVYVIEAPMGTGKTEAALGAAYQVMVDKKARGIYFALPTQATSNRIHRRMAEFVRRIAPGAPGSRLIHANSWLQEEQLAVSPAATGSQMGEEDARVGRDWFASARRALLAPFGVGTLDQALLGVVAAKHFFVRRYALAGKVVILDEVHSYDVYTGTLIDRLIAMLEELGCTVIILSATLTGKRRNQIICSESENDSEANLSYPLITGRRAGEVFPARPVASPPQRHVEIVFASHDDAANQAIALTQHGGCVLWICNTVASAQEHYERLMRIAGERYQLGLLHSRFPYWRREELENLWLERFGKCGETRCASILVSTQIVEQSVDLDADLLITELAPTDMVLQRAGRLWRHERQGRPCPARRLILLEETASLNDFQRMERMAILKSLGGKAYVYNPYVLLRSLKVWTSRQRIRLPVDIRELIEATYEEDDDEPEAWQELYRQGYGEALVHRQIALQASNIWTALLEDDEGVQTRLDENPTLSLVLCRRLSKTDAEFLDGSRADFRAAEFRLPTAQAIHRNLVRLPIRYCAPLAAEHSGIRRYLRGPQNVGLVDPAGAVQTAGLKNDLRLRWSRDLGIVIGDNSAGEDL